MKVATHLGDLEDDGLGSLAGGGDVDVHVAVNVEVGRDLHPLHLLLSLYSWPVALQNCWHEYFFQGRICHFT